MQLNLREVQGLEEGAFEKGIACCVSKHALATICGGLNLMPTPAEALTRRWPWKEYFYLHDVSF